MLVRGSSVLFGYERNVSWRYSAQCKNAVSEMLSEKGDGGTFGAGGGEW